MKHYIGYFDFLGYKQFLLNNTEEHLRRRASHILRDIELALSQGATKHDARRAVGVADLEEVSVNCLNISDTVIFWSYDDSVESCLELLQVCYEFNYRENLHNFPLRGCIIYDSFNLVHGKQYNARGAVYSPNLMYGKGLYHAHEKAEGLNWAGTVIDSSVLAQAGADQRIQEFLAEYAMEFDVPYKNGGTKKEYALRLSHGSLNQTAYGNWVRMVEEVFRNDNKGIGPGVQEKIDNTITFIEAHREV